MNCKIAQLKYYAMLFIKVSLWKFSSISFFHNYRSQLFISENEYQKGTIFTTSQNNVTRL